MRSDKISSAILAGGKGKRMGYLKKGLLEIEGRPIIKKLIDVLKSEFEEIIIVTNNPEDYSSLKKECCILQDKIKNTGPLGGIYTALDYTTKDAVFFTACDMPFVDNTIVKNLLGSYKKNPHDAFVPRIGEHIEPLCAIYKKNVTSAILSFTKKANNYRLTDFLKTVDACFLNMDDTPYNRRIFTNINTIEDLKWNHFQLPK